jgi:hypothetical protein
MFTPWTARRLSNSARLARVPGVLVCDAPRTPRGWWPAGMAPDAGLETGLLSGADAMVVGPERGIVPGPRVEIHDASGLGRNVWVAGNDPRALRPGLERVSGQHPPDGPGTARFAQSRGGSGSSVRGRQPTQGPRGLMDERTGGGVDEGVVQRGKTGLCAPVPRRLPRKKLLVPIVAANTARRWGAGRPPPPRAPGTGAGRRASATPAWPVVAADRRPYAAERGAGRAPPTRPERRDDRLAKALAWGISLCTPGVDVHTTPSSRIKNARTTLQFIVKWEH